jgi:hypothetical protein
MPYRWSRGRGRGRGAGRGGRGLVVGQGRGASGERGHGTAMPTSRGQRGARGGGHSRGAGTQCPKRTILDSLSEDSDVEQDWDPVGLDAGSGREDDGLSYGGSGASEDERQAASLMWELGEYPHGPWPD